jgi:tetratricopeptide (TPR) repeat protein
MSPPSPPASTSTDPFAPFRVNDQLSIPLPPDLRRYGMQVSGSSSGPVNTEEADRDFFTDPRFDRQPNSGRLFYHQFFLSNPHDPLILERRVWFICWSPLDDGSRAQRLPERPGFLIEEVTTDGRILQVHHTAYPGSGTWVDTLRWSGDALGQGRFEIEGTNAPPSRLPDPTPFEIERDRGYDQLSARKPAEAVVAFEKALTLQPKDPAALFALGVAWESLVGIDRTAAAKSIDAYGRALAADPRRAPAHQRRADLYAEQGQIPLALEELTRLIALEPEAWEPHLDRARLHARGNDYPKAIADAGEAARKAPTEVAPLEALARFQLRAGRLPEAIATGLRVLARDDSRSAVRVTMACAHAQQGQSAEALRSYADAQANGVSNPERRWGIRELEQWLRKAPKDSSGIPAVQRLLAQLRGPDALEAAESDAL